MEVYTVCEIIDSIGVFSLFIAIVIGMIITK